MSSKVFNLGGRNKPKVVALQQDNVAVSTIATVTISAALAGYTPVGIVGMTVVNASTSGAYSSFCFPYMFFLNEDGEAEIHLRNTYSSAAKVLVTAYVLYI